MIRIVIIRVIIRKLYTNYSNYSINIDSFDSNNIIII